MKDTANQSPMTGDEFEQALAALGWKQVDFAARTGMTPDSVNRWVHGRQPIPAWVRSHLALLLAADQFHRAHIAPPPRTRRKAGADDQPTDEGQA